MICGHCFLVQLEQSVDPSRIFSQYAYFSSNSDSWLQHARRYARTAIEGFNLGNASQVIEIASNDGYLLQHFVAEGIPCLGIEPARNVAQLAIDNGIPTKVAFLSQTLAKTLYDDVGQANLLIGNNVLAHVPALDDFISALKILLKPQGVLTMEFPHLLSLIKGNQFDTIYHEHYSYLSLYFVTHAFAEHGLTVFDVDKLKSHGGSLRIFAHHQSNHALAVTQRVQTLNEQELEFGVNRLHACGDFSQRVHETKRKLLAFLIDKKRSGHSVVGYGAPGKSCTLLNFCGIGPDFLDYTVDRNRYKQGKLTPGTRIPIEPTERIFQTRPNYVLILP